jgi:hypothetical protein
LPGDVGNGRVGGDDQSSHAERLTNSSSEFIRCTAGGRAPVESLALARVKQSKLNRPARFAKCVFVRLASFNGDNASDLSLMVLHGDDDLVQDQAALDGRRVGPGRLSSFGNRDGFPDIVGPRPRHTR